MNKITYSKSGVDYALMDPIKKLAQIRARSTAKNLDRLYMYEVAGSRGESAYVWEEKEAYHAFVIEGLGTKNLVADSMRRYGKRTYYDAIAQDTVAMVVNDLVVVGADPQIVNAYFAVGDSKWFSDKQRAKDLIEGWTQAVKLAGAVWGGGETPTLKEIIHPTAIDLAGSAVGLIRPKKNLVLGDDLKAGDAILLIESSGIHANGLTLARKIAGKLKKGYATFLPNGNTYGESLLVPTHIYAGLIRELLTNGIKIHYMVNITGHGWRKLMRAEKKFTYLLENIPQPQSVFDFIQQQSGSDDQEMYGNFNMGAGFAIFLEEKYIEEAQKIAKKLKFKSWSAGYVEKGERQVIIVPKKLVYKGETLDLR